MHVQNPICQGADPFVLFHDGRYYHYATNSGNDFHVLVSDDLANWEDCGVCLSPEDVLGEADFWAPEVMLHKDRFYMAYTADWNVGIAVADSPLGPFVQAEKKWATACVDNPNFHKRNGAIDGHFLKVGNTIYLFYARHDRRKNRIFAARLNDSLTEILPETETLVAEPEMPWETAEEAQCNEGPFVLQHNGLFYLTYSGNDCHSPNYGIGCAVSNEPLGPYTKYQEPILKRTDAVHGVGHHSFTTTPNGEALLCVYHCHHSPTVYAPRMTCVDRAAFEESKGAPDRLAIYGPTHTPQEL